MSGLTANTPERVTVDGTEYVRAYPVADGRCEHCGLSRRLWSPAEVLDAIRAHAERTGRAPSRFEWDEPTPEHPEFQVALRMFGSWSAAVRAAGVAPLGPGASLYWTRDRIVEAMVAWSQEHGEAPTVKTWGKAAPGHPAAATVRKHFGTWNAALDAAGFFPRTSYGHVKKEPRSNAGARLLIDAAPVAEALRDYLGPDGTVAALAETMQIDPTPLNKLLAGKREVIEHDAADRILTHIDRPDVLAAVA